MGKRVFNALFSENPKQLGSQIGKDVIIPRIKAGFEEALNSFLAGILWGNSANRPMSNLVRHPMLRGNLTGYSQMSTQNAQQLQARAPVQQSSGNYEDICVKELHDAEVLLAHIYDILNQYNVVCVGDLYEKAGIITAPSDSSFGWLSLQGAQISKIREGYVLELPRPTLI